MQTASFEERVRALNIPLENLIVIGSGVLDALGIRRAGDVDVAVKPAEFERLKQSGDWKLQTKANGLEYLVGDEIEIFTGWQDSIPGESGTYEELLPYTIVINGIRYMTLDFIYDWKTRIKRPKDIADIERIDSFRRITA